MFLYLIPQYQPYVYFCSYISFCMEETLLRVSMHCEQHDDVIKLKHFPCHWSLRHRLPVNSPHKGQWRRALMFSLICDCTTVWINNRDAGDMRRHRAPYDFTVIANANYERIASRSEALFRTEDLWISETPSATHSGSQHDNHNPSVKKGMAPDKQQRTLPNPVSQ